MIQAAADQSVANAQAILDDARAKAQVEADAVKSEGAGDVASIDAQSSKNQDKAVQMVIDALSA